jgi:hypothetical protein
MVALAIALCACAGMASAQTADQCHAKQRAGDLLSCYDGTAPAAAPVKPARSRPSGTADKLPAVPVARDSAAAPKTSVGQKGDVIDVLAVENAKLDTKMKTICRGC